jgi:hypothetical protein
MRRYVVCAIAEQRCPVVCVGQSSEVDVHGTRRFRSPDEPPIDELPIDEPPIDEPEQPTEPEQPNDPEQPVGETPTAVASASDYGVQIYPNPVVDNVVIESTTDIREVRVFDAQGKLLQLVDNQQVTTTLSLSLSALPAGVYLVRVVNGQGVHVSKIVKQ